jgi:hypothetical protein
MRGPSCFETAVTKQKQFRNVSPGDLCYYVVITLPVLESPPPQFSERVVPF